MRTSKSPLSSVGEVARAPQSSSANQDGCAGQSAGQAARAEQTGSENGRAGQPAAAGNSPSLPATSRSQPVRELPPPPRIGQSSRAALPAVCAAPAHGPRWVRWWRRGGQRETASFLASLVLHSGAVLVLAVWQLASGAGGPGGSWQLDLGTEEVQPLDAPLTADKLDVHKPLLPELVRLAQEDWPQPEVPSVDAPDEQLARAQRQPIAQWPEQPVDWLAQGDTDVQGALSGRSVQARARTLGPRGGNQQSEQGVARGLRWLVAHQRDDGSWSFDLSGPFCRGQCSNPGTAASTTAATALALLPFLGAGHTHLEGDYQEPVRRGLYYLTTRALVTRHGVDLQDGTMYGQGLAAIALCEAYGMTQDRNLHDLAQQAIDFICYAQDVRGGGWRYTPGEPGDTTVTGWQLMGLKSAQMAGLHVPTPNIALVHHFLDSVASDEGAQYGYMTPQAQATTTAIGLLCRMYTGWRRDRPALERGVKLLAEWGPSEDNMYYNYYATQVLFHWGGPAWEKWNRQMRDYLVATQATQGHEAGSWHFRGGRGDVGGRLYNTAVAVMTLEVYYRYQPLYTHAAVEGHF